MNRNSMNIYKKNSILLPKRLETKANKTDGMIWNVFVQILLPLVLLLTFVAVQVINIYKEAAENERKHVEALEQYLVSLEQENSAAQERLHKQEAYINLQYQILLNALQKTEQEKLRELKLSMFSEGTDRIHVDGTHVKDNDFKMLCDTAKNIFDQNDEQGFRDNIYREVLEKVSQPPYLIRDPEPGGLQVRRHDTIPEESVYKARFEIITDANRARIHNEIIEFVNQVKKDVMTVQDEVLQILGDQFILHPVGLDQESHS